MKSRQGFASMDPLRQLEIASLGGKSVKPENRSFSKNRELASKAGARGGTNSKGGGRRRSIISQACLNAANDAGGNTNET